MDSRYGCLLVGGVPMTSKGPTRWDHRSFPSVYRVAHTKDASLAENLRIYSDSLQWYISFIKEVQDWVGCFSEFLNISYSTRLRREGEDKILWSH